MKLQRWSLRAKLLGGFGVMTVIVFLVGVIDFFIMHKISSSFTSIIEKNTKQEVAMLEMSSKVTALEVFTYDVQNQKDKNQRTLMIKKVHALHDDYKKVRESYEDIESDGEDEGLYNRVKKAWSSIEGHSDKLMEILAAGNELSNVDYVQVLDAYKKSVMEFNTQAQKLNSTQKRNIESKISEVNKIRTTGEYISLGLILIGIFLPLFLGFIFSKNISYSLRQISGELFQGANLLRGISSEMASSSNSLLSSTSAQAAALQETMSAVSQMAAMISKNSENTNASQKESENSSTSANRGQEAVQFMLGSVQDIEESNMAIMNRIETSHREMSEIVQVINEIALKTKVINEIVFQTKLLSFNASVEAARAGEHGKGFAVVAEEVGNLAQMSGSAAKEITQLLDQSVQKVESIVKRTRDEVEQMMATGSDKVRKGIEGGQRCGGVLNEIVESVNVVHSMLIEIAKASAEQATGVNEIENAMNQLDEITQSNNTSAQLSLSNSDNLKAQADQIAGVVEELNGLLNGTIAGMSTASSTPNNYKSDHPTPPNNVIEMRPRSEFEFKPFHTIANNFESKTMVSGGDTIVPSRDDNRFEDV
jgi:methyl-accepting chemotaxis protein